MPPKEAEPPVVEETWLECVTSYTQNITWIYFAFNVVRVLLGRLSIGDFFFNTISSLIVSSALHGEHFSKDLQSTILGLLLTPMLPPPSRSSGPLVTENPPGLRRGV